MDFFDHQHVMELLTLLYKLQSTCSMGDTRVVLLLFDHKGDKFLTIEHPCHDHYVLPTANYDETTDVNLFYTMIRAYNTFIKLPFPQLYVNTIRHVHLVSESGHNQHIFIARMQTPWDTYTHEATGGYRIHPFNTYVRWYRYDLSERASEYITIFSKIVIRAIQEVSGLGITETATTLHCVYPVSHPHSLRHPTMGGSCYYEDLTLVIVAAKDVMYMKLYRDERTTII